MPSTLVKRLTRAYCALVMFGVVLPACTSLQPAVATNERLTLAPGQVPGFMVGSVGRRTSGKAASNASLNSLGVRNVETGADFRLAYNFGIFASTAEDIRDDGKSLAVFRLALPPGEYEIYQVQFYDAAASWESTRNFSLPVTVQAGEEVYIGEAVAAAIPSTTWGMIDRIGYRFDFTDQRQRDFPVLQAHFPEFSPGKARTFIPARAIILAPPELVIVPADAGMAELESKLLGP